MATVSNIEILADPVGFTAAILGHHIWRIPAQILESLAKNRHTAVKSCHASGKTFTAAEAVIWWITRWGDGILLQQRDLAAGQETVMGGNQKDPPSRANRVPKAHTVGHGTEARRRKLRLGAKY